jgi:hypothetical protein
LIKKGSSISQGSIKKGASPDPELKFSFKFFDSTDDKMCPGDFRKGYTQVLMERLKSLSSWKVKEFVSKPDKSIRNHQHDWPKTSRPDGFPNLNEQFSSYPGWQFCLTSNEHGRVHGILVDDTFHIIWLDHDHNLYP